MGDTEGLIATEKLMEEEGKGRLKHQCFADFKALERISEGERKEEDLMIKIVPGSRIFSSNVPRMLGFRDF